MKKLIVFFILFFIGVKSFATTYYVSASGLSTNTGTSSSSPWNYAKLKSFTLYPGDNILFNKGDSFYGALTISTSGTSGNPITYGAYGSGVSPIITGFTTVSAWTNLGGNIWQSTSTVPVNLQPNMVLINRVSTPMGRYPNTGWSLNTSSTSTSITSGALSAGTWTGAEIVTKDERYIIDRRKITSQSGGTVNFVANPNYNPQNGWGYFIQNSLATLDVQNEWFYNSATSKIDIYSTSSPTGVQVSTVDTLVTLLGKNYITFNGIDFEGANDYDFLVGYSSHVTIENCSLNFCGNQAILGQNWGSSSAYLTVQNCTFNGTQDNAINIPTEFTNAYLGYNTITNTGLIPGMSDNGDAHAVAIYARGNTSTIEYNNIDSIGYTGIYFDGSNVTVNNNLINHYCLTKDDGGGIYTYSNEGFTGRVVKSNIVLNGIGNNDGLPIGDILEAHGIYMDGYTNDFSILNNTVYNASYSGIFLQGNTNGIVKYNTVYNPVNRNTVYDPSAAISAEYLTFTPTNMTIIGNIFVAGASIFCVEAPSIVAAQYTMDSNYYCRPIDDNLTFQTNYSSTYNLVGWKTYTTRDAHSQKSPKTITSPDSLTFLYNATSSAVVISLPYNYEDMKGVQYNGTIILQPFTSVILIQNGSKTGGALPPTVVTSGNQSIAISTATISATGTPASGKTITGYLWTKVSGPGSITSSTSASTGLTGLSGTSTYNCTVTQSDGQTVTSPNLTITVTTAAPPTVSTSGNQTITSPANSVTVSATGTAAAGYSINSYSWTKMSGIGNITSPSSSTTTITGLSGVSTYKCTVTENDPGNQTATSAILTITVNSASNTKPYVIFKINHVFTHL